MLRVGLTGGIASGKSTVGQMFVGLGCHLIDADAIVHRLFESGQNVNRAVAKEFGDRVVGLDGRINRIILGEIVFNDPAAREKLNSIVHPAVVEIEKEWLEKLEQQDPHAIGIVDAALMIEIGTYQSYNKLIVVVCSPSEQRRRLQARSGLSHEQIEMRISSQMPMSEKVKYADYVIDTSGSLGETRQRVEAVFRELTRS
jgi:dephospho-CoA kinase